MWILSGGPLPPSHVVDRAVQLVTGPGALNCLRLVARPTAVTAYFRQLGMAELATQGREGDVGSSRRQPFNGSHAYKMLAAGAMEEDAL